MNHGAYVVCSDSRVYNSYIDNFNNKQIGPKFGSGDLIEITYDSQANTIIFKKQGEPQKYIYDINP